PEPVTIPPLGLFAGQRSATDFGNAGVGILQAPSQLNFDFSVIKTTHITERQTLQFRAEFFNLFNHSQFGPPGPPPAIGAYRLPNVSSPTDGWITATSVNPRVVQLALKFAF